MPNPAFIPPPREQSEVEETDAPSHKNASISFIPPPREQSEVEEPDVPAHENPSISFISPPREQSEVEEPDVPAHENPSISFIPPPREQTNVSIESDVSYSKQAAARPVAQLRPPPDFTEDFEDSPSDSPRSHHSEGENGPRSAALAGDLPLTPRQQKGDAVSTHICTTPFPKSSSGAAVERSPRACQTPCAASPRNADSSTGAGVGPVEELVSSASSSSAPSGALQGSDASAARRNVYSDMKTAPGMASDTSTTTKDTLHSTKSASSRSSLKSSLSSSSSAVKRLAAAVAAKKRMFSSGDSLPIDLDNKIDEKLVRIFTFKTSGKHRELRVSHYKFVWYLQLDGKLVAQKSHSNLPWMPYSTSMDIDLLGADREEAPEAECLMATLRMDWKLMQQKWQYSLLVGDVDLPPCWMKGANNKLETNNPEDFDPPEIAARRPFVEHEN